jgi:hypothetical protein
VNQQFLYKRSFAIKRISKFGKEVILKVFLFARSEGIKKNKKKSKVKIAIFLYLDFSFLAKKKWKDD